MTAAEPKQSKRYPKPLDKGRSANMKANRRTDTKPELRLRSALHALGYRYRKDHRLDLPLRRVRPDIAFTARKVAVFVDGCFLHACPDHGQRGHREATSSAIWTAFRAAPLRRLSLLTNRTRPRPPGTDWSERIRPT